MHFICVDTNKLVKEKDYYLLDPTNDESGDTPSGTQEELAPVVDRTFFMRVEKIEHFPGSDGFVSFNEVFGPFHVHLDEGAMNAWYHFPWNTSLIAETFTGPGVFVVSIFDADTGEVLLDKTEVGGDLPFKVTIPDHDLVDNDTGEKCVSLPKCNAAGGDDILDDSSGFKASFIMSIGDANVPPIANAGPDQTVNENTLVTLDASASTDPVGTIVSYSWSQTVGPAVVLDDATLISPTFTSPDLVSDVSLTFVLTVIDDFGEESNDEVIITVEDVP